MELINSGPFAQGFIHDKLPLAGRFCQESHQLIEGQVMKIFGKAQAVTADFQRTDGLLKGLLIILANAHCLADCAHLGPEFVLHPGKFFKGPARKFNHHILARRGIFFQGAVTPVGNFV